MDVARTAELQVLLEGVPLPAGKRELLEHARREGAAEPLLAGLQTLPSRRYESIDEVGEELHRVQPLRRRREPHLPSEESGATPGGGEYTNPRPESGAVRAYGSARG